MLLRLANRRHQVMTGVALVDRARIEQQVVVTQVAFGPITPQQAAAYWHTGEPADKAGGYAIQGLAAVFVERIEGSFSNVVGLPLYETAQLLRAFAVPTGVVGCYCPLARIAPMSDEILVNVGPTETRVALIENGVVQEIYIERVKHKGFVGNIYKGKVVRVLPGMQAAFCGHRPGEGRFYSRRRYSTP